MNYGPTIRFLSYLRYVAWQVRYVSGSTVVNSNRITQCRAVNVIGIISYAALLLLVIWILSYNSNGI